MIPMSRTITAETAREYPTPRGSIRTPAFSVVIPLYNKQGFVRQTLKSVLAQTCPAAEVIIVDDSSTDDGPKVIADLLNDRVRMVHQTNAGPGPARNRGAELASAEWIALIDADDLWHPKHLATLAAIITAFPQADVVTAGSRWQPAGVIDLGPLDLPDPAPYLFDYFKDPTHGQVHTSSLAIRRNVFLSKAGFGAFVPGEDVEFWARLALDHQFAASALPTSVYVRENGGIMDQDRRQFDKKDVDAPTPLSMLINRALADDRYSARHRAISAYSDRTQLQAVRNCLYAGNAFGARRILARLRNRRTVQAKLYQVATLLPDEILEGAARVYSAIKRVQRHRRGPRSTQLKK